MAYWIGNYMLAFLISVLLAGLIIPNIIHIAFSRNLFDSQDERKIHRGVVPRLGGISFLPSIIFSFALLAGSNLELGIEEMADQLAATIVPIFFMICSIMLMYLVGIADDLIGVRYRVKFVFQIISGILIVCSGLSIYNLYGFLGIYEWPAPIGWAAAIFLVVFVVNSINLIDGIDGLARPQRHSPDLLFIHILHFRTVCICVHRRSHTRHTRSILYLQCFRESGD